MSTTMVEKFQRYVRSGLVRSRSSLGQALLMALCAVLAYLFAERVLGHPAPIFTATSALIALQFSSDLRSRRVLEVAIGCTLGVAGGGLFTLLLGQGPAQSVLIVFAFVVVARFLDKGAVFATQMAIQAVLASMRGTTLEGILDTSIDAAVGGGCALLFTALAPLGRHRLPRQAIAGLAGELSAVLRQCAAALEANDSTLAWHALVRARSSQSAINETAAVLARAHEAAILSPFRRRAGMDLLLAAAGKLDLGLRNSRVFSRRLTYAINNAALSEAAAGGLAGFLAVLAGQVEALAEAFAEADAGRRDARLARCRGSLVQLAGRLAPGDFGATTLEGQALIVVLRPLLVDVMEAAGSAHGSAEAALPRISDPVGR